MQNKLLYGQVILHYWWICLEHTAVARPNRTVPWCTISRWLNFWKIIPCCWFILEMIWLKMRNTNIKKLKQKKTIQQQIGQQKLPCTFSPVKELFWANIAPVFRYIGWIRVGFKLSRETTFHCLWVIIKNINDAVINATPHKAINNGRGTCA